MNSVGIRILDLKNDICVPLVDILSVIDENSLNWVVLWLDVRPKRDVEFVVKLEKQINKSKDGWPIPWESLLELSKKFFQEIDLTIIGCKNKSRLHRYEEDAEMYRMCDVVIEMIDGGYWEVFSSDLKLIEKLKSKFEKIELLETNFEK